MDILDLVVAEPWFGLMASGIKTEEFRRDCDHWRKRLLKYPNLFNPFESPIDMGHPLSECFRKYDFIRIRNGNGADRPKSVFVFQGIRWQADSISRQYGDIKLKMPGALFVISLGERIEK